MIFFHCSKRITCLVSLNSKLCHFRCDRSTVKSLPKYVAFALVSDMELLRYLEFSRQTCVLMRIPVLGGFKIQIPF